MNKLTRKAAVYAAAASTVLATAGAGLAFSPADLVAPQPVKAQTASGKVTSNDAFFIEFQAKRAKGAKETQATGFFSGEAKLGGTRLLKFSGPITCLNVQGSSVGFFYPVTSSDPAVVGMLGAGVFIYIDTDGRGNATSFSFLPAPTVKTDGCAPLLAPVPASGKTVLTGG